MRRLRLSFAAQRDLNMIQDHGLAEFGLVAVRAHMEGFDRIFTLLRDHPLAGQARPDVGESIRAFTHPPHRILYRLTDDALVIARVIHAAQDMGRVTGIRR